MSVYKRNNNWYCRGRINGERYHRCCNGASTKEEAKIIETTIRYNLTLKQNGVTKEKKVITFGCMMSKYIAVRTANRTNVKLAKVYKKYLVKYFTSSKNIFEITPFDVEQFKCHLIEQNKSNQTINHYLVALKRAYNILIEDGVSDYNPVTKVKLLTTDNKRYRYLSKAEWKRLKIALPTKLRYIVTVALLTGLRKKNVLNLKWEQIDFSMNTLEVLKQNNKGKKVIRLPMSKGLVEVLKEIGPKEKGYLFVNSKTGLPYTDIRKPFNQALKRARINDFVFHDLRRTFGTWLLQKGVDIRVIQTLLCHSDVSTTERYLAITPEASKRAMTVIDEFVI